MSKGIITTSWDDGCAFDLKLAELLQKHDVSATFYIPLENSERNTLAGEEIIGISRYFDIGGHSFNHVDLTRMNPASIRAEIISGKDRLEQIIGRQVFSFSYPFGKNNEEIARIVKTAGFAGARTVNEYRRFIRDPFQVGTMLHASNYLPLHHIKHSVQSFDSQLFLFLLKRNLFFKSWERIAAETLGFVMNNGGIWHLWGHSWEIQENDDWSRLENLLKQIKSAGKTLNMMDNSQTVKTYTNATNEGQI